MSELALWKSVKNGLSRHGVLQRHENTVGVGVPDVSLALRGRNLWIELKFIKAWPKRESTIVKLRHFTKVQRAWIMTRGKAGGGCYFLLRVGIGESADHLLINWREITLDDTRTRKELVASACYYCRGTVAYDLLAVNLIENY